MIGVTNGDAVSGEMPLTAAAQQEFAMLRRRIHAAIGGDVTVVAGFMAAWARHDSEPPPEAGRATMRCPIPGHEDPQASCAVFKAAEDPAVRFECCVCGSSGDVVTAHQLIFGSDVRQAMRAVWAALAGTLWQNSPDPRAVDTPHRLASIIDAAAGVCGISAEKITGYDKAQRYSEARQLAMFAARAATDLSYPAIARAFGGRDHTTVLHGVRRIERLITERDDLREKLQAIEAWVQPPPVEQGVQR